MLNAEKITKAKRRVTIYSYLLQKRVKQQLLRFSRKPSVVIIRLDEESNYDSHIIDDLPLTINRDPRPGIRQENVSL